MDHERQLSERRRCRFARLCMIDSFMGTNACQVTAGGLVLSFPFERGPDIARGVRLMLIDTRITGRNGAHVEGFVRPRIELLPRLIPASEFLTRDLRATSSQ